MSVAKITEVVFLLGLKNFCDQHMDWELLRAKKGHRGFGMDCFPRRAKNVTKWQGKNKVFPGVITFTTL